MAVEHKRYVGDGVYAQFDGYHLWVYTDNGIEQSDKIALEPAVLNALVKFYKDIQEQGVLPHA